MDEYAALKQDSAPVAVPVANTGGAGTRDSHWRESVFGNELMTGFLNASSNPLSRLTVAAMEDMGYQVNYNVADAFTLPSALILAELGVGAALRDHGGHGVVFFPDQTVLPGSALAND